MAEEKHTTRLCWVEFRSHAARGLSGSCTLLPITRLLTTVTASYLPRLQHLNWFFLPSLLPTCQPMKTGQSFVMGPPPDPAHRPHLCPQAHLGSECGTFCASDLTRVSTLAPVPFLCPLFFVPGPLTLVLNAIVFFGILWDCSYFIITLLESTVFSVLCVCLALCLCPVQ